MVHMKGLEPPLRKELDPKSSASASSATCAVMVISGWRKTGIIWVPARALLGTVQSWKILRKVPRQTGSLPQISTGKRIDVSQLPEWGTGEASKASHPTENPNEEGTAGAASMAAEQIHHM